MGEGFGKGALIEDICRPVEGIDAAVVGWNVNEWSKLLPNWNR